MTTTIYIDVKIDWLSEINLLIEYLSTRKIIWRSQFISEGPSFSSLKDVKKSHTFQEGGAHLRISIWYLLMNLKNNYLLKKLLSRPIKSVRILILQCGIKKTKNPGDIIILHLRTKYLDDMIYSSWDIECVRLKLVLMGLFFFSLLPRRSPPPPNNPKNQNLRKLK